MSRKEGYSLPKDVEESQKARFLNEEIKDLYGIELKCCPYCSSILKIERKSDDRVCWVCCTVVKSKHMLPLF